MRTCFKILIASVLFLNASCNKEKATDEKACWQMIDYSGNPLNVVCDKTEAELIQCISDSTCGTYPFNSSISNCFYYRVEEEEFCWLINDYIYLGHITEGEAKLLARCRYNNGTLKKIECDSCEKWYTRDKQTYKPTSAVHYSVVTARFYCDDTLATIYQGRQIIKKDDADSLIVIQFSYDGYHW